VPTVIIVAWSLCHCSYIGCGTSSCAFTGKFMHFYGNAARVVMAEPCLYFACPAATRGPRCEGVLFLF
jgi:hypothetical protein